MPRDVLFITHIDDETGGLAREYMGDLSIRTLDRPIQTPELDDVAGIVILGGAMSAADEDKHPSLAATRGLALAAIDADIPVLGLCLGHQILGRALGGKHEAGVVDERGMATVEVVAEDRYLGSATGPLQAVQWHTDIVSLPPGASLLARNAAVPNQAFRYGSAVGVQFHLEADDAVIEKWCTAHEPPMSAGMGEGAWQTWRDAWRADAHLHAVAKACFTAFAEDARARL